MTILTWKQTKNLEIKFQLSWLSHPRLDASGYMDLHLFPLLLLLLLHVACCCCSGADLGGGCRGCAPPPTWDDLQFSNTTGVLPKKKTMWFIGVEVEQETSAPPPKKILDPPLLLFFFLSSRCLYSFNINCCYNELIKGNLQKLWNKVLYYLFTCKAAFEIIGLNLKISVIWQNINMIKQDNPNIKYTELKDQSMMDFHGPLGLIGMEEINVSFKQL